MVRKDTVVIESDNLKIRICDNDDKEVWFEDKEHVRWVPLSRIRLKGPEEIYRRLEKAGYMNLPTLENFKIGLEKIIREAY